MIKDNITIAKIGDTFQEYHMCVKKGKEPLYKEKFVFIGTGTIYSVNGIKQSYNKNEIYGSNDNPNEIYDFYVRTKEFDEEYKTDLINWYKNK